MLPASILVTLFCSFILIFRWSTPPSPSCSVPTSNSGARIVRETQGVRLWLAPRVNYVAGHDPFSLPTLLWIVETDSIVEVMTPPKSATRLSVDIGAFATSPSSKMWWKNPSTFVIALEPNPVSFAMLARAAAGDVGGPVCDLDPQCASPWKHIIQHREMFVPLQLAAGIAPHNTLVGFRLGVANRSDVGSLLPFRRRFTRRRNASTIAIASTRIVTLSQLLRQLMVSCGSLLWDTLKIDAQGADAMVMLSSLTSNVETATDMSRKALKTAQSKKSLLSRFGCVVGEFNNRAYISTSDALSKQNESSILTFRFRRGLRLAGFAEVDERVWINARLAVDIEKRRTQSEIEQFVRRYACSASDEQKRSDELFFTAISRYRSSQ